MSLRVLVPAALALAATACNSVYDRVDPGTLSGKLTVEWYGPDEFIFRPHETSPLTFVRADGSRIVPGTMYTDGGSIPRPLWIIRNYSPWGYAPAFIVHDWLFEMKHCRHPGHDQYTHAIAASVMAEVMKTMMEGGKVPVDAATVGSMYLAVSSPIAESHWNDGACVEPDPEEAAREPVATYEISF